LLSADGAYQKQRIVMNTAGPILFCEHGSWTATTPGSIDFVPCKGDPYKQSWSYTPNNFVLQGVEYEVDPAGIFNCGPTDC
jgi:hypothetical protein